MKPTALGALLGLLLLLPGIAQGAETNLLLNPGFENGPESWAERADSQSGSLSVTLNLDKGQTTYLTSDSLLLRVSANNPGIASPVDVYLGMILPDGTIRIFTPSGPQVVSLQNLAAWTPFLGNFNLSVPFTITDIPILSLPFADGDPIGEYTMFLGVVVAGALADNRVDAAELLALGTAPFRHLPGAVGVTDNSGRVSLRVAGRNFPFKIRDLETGAPLPGMVVTFGLLEQGVGLVTVIDPSETFPPRFELLAGLQAASPQGVRGSEKPKEPAEVAVDYWKFQAMIVTAIARPDTMGPTLEGFVTAGEVAELVSAAVKLGLVICDEVRAGPCAKIDPKFAGKPISNADAKKEVLEEVATGFTKIGMAIGFAGAAAALGLVSLPAAIEGMPSLVEIDEAALPVVR